MTCRRCGKALSNDQPTCPFCGAFIDGDQIQSFVDMKKEKSRDLRPKLISEKYGMEPRSYEKKDDSTKNYFIFLPILIGILLVFMILFILL